jgi:hypothetical protein
MSATEKCLERLTTIIEQQQQLLAQLGETSQPKTSPINPEFIMESLANSIMASHSKHGLQNMMICLNMKQINWRIVLR